MDNLSIPRRWAMPNLEANSINLPLKSESIQCVVTSPPYWGLRKYDIPDSIWDGDEGCEHEWQVDFWKGKSGGKKSISAGGILRPSGHSQGEQSLKENAFCLHCNAWRGQLGYGFSKYWGFVFGWWTSSWR